MTPWLKRDIDIVIRAPEKYVFKKYPYLGVHIRRGDKISKKEASYHASEVNRLLGIAQTRKLRRKPHRGPQNLHKGSLLFSDKVVF